MSQQEAWRVRQARHRDRKRNAGQKVLQVWLSEDVYDALEEPKSAHAERLIREGVKK